jgi:hypothetical protein
LPPRNTPALTLALSHSCRLGRRARGLGGRSPGPQRELFPFSRVYLYETRTKALCLFHKQPGLAMSPFTAPFLLMSLAGSADAAMPADPVTAYPKLKRARRVAQGQIIDGALYCAVDVNHDLPLGAATAHVKEVQRHKTAVPHRETIRRSTQMIADADSPKVFVCLRSAAPSAVCTSGVS